MTELNREQRRRRRRQAKGHDLIHGGHSHPDIAIPLPYRRIIDAVAARDRAWFEEEAHHGFRHYIRQSVPGEFWQPDGLRMQSEWTIVTQIEEGVRTRRPLRERGPLGEAAAAGVTLFGPGGEEAAFYVHEEASA